MTEASKRPGKEPTPIENKAGAKGHDAQIIRLLITDNPKKKGSKAAGRYRFYKDGMTVNEFLTAGGTRLDVSWDHERKHIRVENAA